IGRESSTWSDRRRCKSSSRPESRQNGFSVLPLRNQNRVCIIYGDNRSRARFVPFPNAQAVHGLSPPDSPAFRVKHAPRRVPVIGLVGGIGSGKSYLARLLRKKHPIEIVEGDAAGHLVLQEPSVKESVRKAFGDTVFTTGGEVDRSRVKELVFGPGPEHKTALKKLEQIVHPRITEILTRHVAEPQSRADVEAAFRAAAL